MLLWALLLPFVACADDGEGEALGPVAANQYLYDHKVAKIKSWNKKYDCYTESGNTKMNYCIKADEKNGDRYKQDASLYTQAGRRRGCEVVSVAWHNNQKCRFCNMLSAAYFASDKVTGVAIDTFSVPFAAVMVVILVIWLAIKALTYTSFLTTQDAAKYITDILLQAFKFLLAYFALANMQEVFDYLILPIFNSGLKFATTFVNAGMDISPDDIASAIERVKDNTYYKQETYEYLNGFAYSVNMQFSLLQTVGKILMCLGGKFLTLFDAGGDKLMQFGLGFNCLIYGLLFFLLGFLLSLAFVFYLFDAVVELGIFGAVLPFAIACWPFKLFTKTAGTAIKLFMNSTFTFMMAGVAVKICVALVSSALGATGQGGHGMDSLVQAIDTLDVNEMKELLAVISIGFLLFAFASLTGFMLVGKVAALTGIFAKGGLSPAAPAIATMGASAVTGTVKKASNPVTKAVDKKVDGKAKELMGKAGQSSVAKVAAATVVAGPVGTALMTSRVVSSVRRRKSSGGSSGG